MLKLLANSALRKKHFPDTEFLKIFRTPRFSVGLARPIPEPLDVRLPQSFNGADANGSD